MSESNNSTQAYVFGHSVLTRCATCMTFRHRHFRLSRLIETVEFDGERSRANTRIKRRQRLRYNGAEKEVVCFS
jgi:hypothetical protein